MRFSPEEYGAYWSGAVRLAVGVLLVLLVHRLVEPLIDHSEVAAQALGWVVLGLGVFVGAFAGALGMAIIIRTAVAAEATR